MPDPREARLPKWAQAELDRLRREVTRIREDFEEYADATLDPNVHDVVTGAYNEHPKPVASAGEDVRFYLSGCGGHRWIDVRVNPGEPTLRVMASSGLRIEPHVTNHLTLSLTRD